MHRPTSLVEDWESPIGTSVLNVRAKIDTKPEWMNCPKEEECLYLPWPMKTWLIIVVLLKTQVVSFKLALNNNDNR